MIFKRDAAARLPTRRGVYEPEAALYVVIGSTKFRALAAWPRRHDVIVVNAFGLPSQPRNRALTKAQGYPCRLPTLFRGGWPASR